LLAGLRRIGLIRNARDGNASRPVGRGGSPLRRRRRRQRGIVGIRGIPCLLLSLFVTLSLELVLQILNVVVGVVLKSGLGWPRGIRNQWFATVM